MTGRLACPVCIELSIYSCTMSTTCYVWGAYLIVFSVLVSLLPFSTYVGFPVRVLFADVEGQGDRDAAYDARLASAILPLTKCVIFNWRDSLQVDRMLNLLGVMQRAAHNVDLGESRLRYVCWPFVVVHGIASVDSTWCDQRGPFAVVRVKMLCV